MTFSQKLTGYLQLCGASYPQLAKASGLSVSTVARYKNGEREPAYDSKQLLKLADGIVVLAAKVDHPLEKNEVFLSLQKTLQNRLDIDYQTYTANLGALLKTLNIRSSTLAKALSFDPSHISKVLSGQRRPGNLSSFTLEIGAYVSRHCTSEQDIAALAALIHRDAREPESPREIRDAVVEWLGSNAAVTEDNPLAHFLETMDTFRPDDFINTIRFDDIRLPTTLFQLPTAKTYTTLEGMERCELDFIRATLVSKSQKDCILFCDMPLEEMAKNKEFVKKWMLGMAMMLKKGLHLHVIHDVSRPFSEMMLGLESYIPLYMTGQISPWYLPVRQNDIFTHLLRVSGAAAMEGSAIAGYHAEGRYYLSKAEEDLRFCRKKAERLLEKAKPLMDIYRSSRCVEFADAMRRTRQDADRLTVSSAIPVYTLTGEVLGQILSRCGIPEKEAREIELFRQNSRRAAEEYLSGGKLTLVVPDPGREQFEASPLYLALSEIFFETDVPYTFEEYQTHIALTRQFAEAHPNMTLKTDEHPVFKNISYTVVGNHQVIISKNKYPTIHFIIHHKKMVQSFQNFIPPIKD